MDWEIGPDGSIILMKQNFSFKLKGPRNSGNFLKLHFIHRMRQRAAANVVLAFLKPKTFVNGCSRSNFFRNLTSRRWKHFQNNEHLTRISHSLSSGATKVLRIHTRLLTHALIHTHSLIYLCSPSLLHAHTPMLEYSHTHKQVKPAQPRTHTHTHKPIYTNICAYFAYI